MPERLHSARGPGRILVAVYGVLALAATGRSILQVTEYFWRAPLAYALSALAGAATVFVILVVGLLGITAVVLGPAATSMAGAGVVYLGQLILIVTVVQLALTRRRESS